MKMEPDGPISRVERTFWTVWYYISGAVNRFLRPEPTNTVGNDQDSGFQQSAVVSEPADTHHPEGDSGGRDVDEERPLAIVSLLSSSRPIVAWELCTTDVDLGPEEESIEYNSQLSEGHENKASEEGESMREEKFGQTGNDDAGLLIFKVARATKAEEAENGDQKSFTHGQGETAENYVYKEHAKMESLNFTDNAMSEDMGGNRRKAGAEKETWGPMIQDEHQKLDETMGKIQVKERDKMHHEDEQALEAGNAEITLCQMTDFSSEEEHSMHREEARLHKDAADTAVMHEDVENTDGVSQLASENKSIHNEGGNQVQNQPSVCEELSENDRDVKGGLDVFGNPGLTSLPLDNELKMTCGKSGNVSEGVGQEVVMAHSERDEIEDESTLGEMELGGEENVSEAADNQAIDEEPQQEEDIKTVTEESQCFTEHVTCHEEVVQNAEAELHTDEFTDREKEDVAKDTEVQTKQRETDLVEGTANNEKSNVTTTDISVEERFFDKDQVEEGRFSSEEEDNKESCIEIACTATSVTVTSQGETGQEISEHIPPGVFEVQIVSQELNFTSCEETQEGVPEYNNEPGPEENTTQRFLEEGNRREINATQLPEEVESKESGSLQNTGTGGGFLLVRGHMEEEEERTEDIDKDHNRLLQLTHTGVPQETEKPIVEPAIEGSEHLFEEGEETFLNSSMKTGAEHFEKEFERHGCVTDDKTTKELQDGTEELLVNFQKGEGLSGTRDAAGDGRETMRAAAADDLLVGFTGETLKVLEAEVQKVTESSFFQDARNSERNSSKTPVLKDVTKSGLMEQLDETEPKLLEDSAVQMQDAVEDEMQIKNEMDTLNVEVAGPAAMLTTENNKNMLFAKCELSRPDESLETQGQLSEEALEVSSEEKLTDSEAANELITTKCKPEEVTLLLTEKMAKHVTQSEGTCAEKSISSVGECRDVIAEEILDSWLETALLKDASCMEQQEGPEPGQEMDKKTKPSNEGQEEMPSLHSEEEMESDSGESGLASDTEMSPSTAGSGLLDLSVSEWGKEHIETHLLESTSTGSFQGIYDMSVCMSESADISKFYTQQPDSQDILLEGTEERRRSDLAEEELTAEMGSSEAGQLNLESNKSQDKASEERIEAADTETGPQIEIDAGVAARTEMKDTGGADAGTLTKMRALFKDEKMNVADVLLGFNVSDSPDATRSGSEALLTESQSDTCIEAEKFMKFTSLDKQQATTRWEDITESLAEPNRTEVAGQWTTNFEVEVDASALDFTAQRSRIAVKNPCVRPPKDPRSLLHMPSVDPTPSPRLPVRVPKGVPLGGVGIGIKLPGLGAGFPVLRKTHVVTEEKSPETPLQEPETKPEEKRDIPKHDEAQHRPKWMPPRHPGFGNPLMSELKTKLKKTPKE